MSADTSDPDERKWYWLPYHVEDSPKKYLEWVWKDPVNLITRPIYWGGDQWRTVAIDTAIVGALLPLDDPVRDADDMFVNLRYMTSVDAAYLSRRRRVARLSNAAVIALRRRVTQFFTDYAPPPAELLLADASGGLVRNDRDLARLSLASEPNPVETSTVHHDEGDEES